VPFSHFAVVSVENVLHCEAGAGGTYEIAESAIDAAAVILIPHFRLGCFYVDPACNVHSGFGICKSIVYKEQEYRYNSNNKID